LSLSCLSDGHSDESTISDTIPRTCTIFTAAQGDKVLFGNNEDYTNPNTYYWVIPSSEGNFGGVYVGFDNLSPQGGINEKRLAFDTNGLPPADLNPRSELPAAPPGWIVETIMKEAATVEEAIDIARRYHRYNWGLPMKYQVFLADATGDAVVISTGSEDELAFTRKQEGDGYLVSTNFNQGNPENRYGDLPCWRYDTATMMLREIQSEEDLTVCHFRSILDAVHVEGAATNTIYSNVFDLRDGVIYLYHWHQFDEVVTLNVAQELARAPSPTRIRDLFSQETVTQAQKEHLRYQGKVDVGVWKDVAQGWLFLAACSLAFVLFDLVFSTRTSIRILLVWGAIAAVFGLVGWLAYLFSYRRQQAQRTTLYHYLPFLPLIEPLFPQITQITQIDKKPLYCPGRTVVTGSSQPLHSILVVSYSYPFTAEGTEGWQRALSATICRVAVYAIYLILAVLFFIYIQPNPGPASILALTYALPFIINLLILAAPHAATRLGIKYWVAVRRSALSEFISANLTFVGMFPTVFFLESWWFPGPTDLGNPLLWFMMSVAAMMGVLALYPLNVWTDRRKFISWPIMLTAAQGTLEETTTLPSLQNAWVALLLSIALFVGSLGLLAMDILLP